MLSQRYTLAATVMVCVSAAFALAILSMLDKEGRLVAGLSGHVFVLASPFLGIAVGAAWWREHRWLPFVGLAVATVAAGLSLWGQAGDYLAWSRTPPGEEAMYFGAFIAMLGGWILCLGFVGMGSMAWLIARPQRGRPQPGAAAD